MVGSVYGAAQYLCHYMCKNESKALGQLISRNLENLSCEYYACHQNNSQTGLGSLKIYHSIDHLLLKPVGHALVVVLDLNGF